MAPGIEKKGVCQWNSVASGDDDQRVVFTPVVADVGTDRKDREGGEMKLGKVHLEIVGPLVTQSSLFQTDVDKKVMQPGGGSDSVASGKNPAVGQCRMGKAACFGRIDRAVEGDEHVGKVLFAGRGEGRQIGCTPPCQQRHQDEKDKTVSSCHPIAPCVAN